MVDIRKGFHQSLEEIRQEMVVMAALVTEGIPRATEAMLAGDMTTAQAIVDGDDPLEVLGHAQRIVERREKRAVVLAVDLKAADLPARVRRKVAACRARLPVRAAKPRQHGGGQVERGQGYCADGVLHVR